MNYKSISKITFYSILMIILLAVGLTIFVTTFNDWLIYDNKYLMGLPEFVMPVDVQVYRAIMILLLVLFISTWLASLWEMNKIDDKKIKLKYFLTGGLFVWLLLPYTFYIAGKEKSYQKFWAYLKTKKETVEQISISKWFSSFKNKKNRLFWNTSLFLFLMLVVMVDFSLIWIRKQYVQDDPSGNMMFNTFSFFTQWTNFSIIIFVLIFSFAHQTITFRNNTLLILMTSYITVVGVTFWTYLLPFGNFKNSYSHLPSFVKTVWLHTVTPATFICFSINSLFISKEKPITFTKTTIMGLPFPIIYGSYAYSICFVTRHSVYGFITNLNPNMIDFGSGIKGNPLYFLFFFGISLIFLFFFFFFWKTAHKAYRNGVKLNELAKKSLL